VTNTSTNGQMDVMLMKRAAKSLGFNDEKLDSNLLERGTITRVDQAKWMRA
jgi:hypothetical protein